MRLLLAGNPLIKAYQAPAIMLLLCVLNAGSALVTAVKSDNFVERIGVVTHFGYTDLPYGTQYEQCKQRLTELGIRYVRDGADPEPAKHHEGIYDTCGIRMLMVSSHAGSQLWDTTLASAWLSTKLGTYNPASVLAIEGTNEYNGSNRTAWASELIDFTHRLWTSAKADPLWESTPVIGPTLSSGVYGTVGDISHNVDFGALHWYPAGLEASHHEFNYFTWHLTQAQATMYPGKKIWLTETGYHNAAQSTWFVSEDAAAKYQPRALLWFLYYNGIERTFIYELLDEAADVPADPEKNWGLLRNDLSPKPVFIALKNLISLLKDADTVFTPAPLDYSIQGDTAGIMQVLFQKKSGAWYLAIWQEARSWNDTTRTDKVIPRRSLTLDLASAAPLVNVFEPCDPAVLSIEPVATLTNESSIILSVPDHVMLVEISPATSTTISPAAGIGTAMDKNPAAVPRIGFHTQVLSGFSDSQSRLTETNPVAVYSPCGRFLGQGAIGRHSVSFAFQYNGVYIIKIADR